MNSEDFHPRIAPSGKHLPLPAMRSYAQNFEDVILRRALQDIAEGFYVDVGAFDPRVDSVTCWFYESGWRGLNLEPNPDCIQHFRTARPRDINVWGAAGRSTGTATLQIIGDTGLSTLKEENSLAADAQGFAVSGTSQVPVYTLADLLLEREVPPEFDFLKIDAEGSEADVLMGADFSRWRPRVVVVEAVRPFTYDANWSSWEPKLLSHEYSFVWFDGLNRFYLRNEDSARAVYFGLPAGVFDNFSIQRSEAISVPAPVSFALETEGAESAAGDATRNLANTIAVLTNDLTNALRHTRSLEAQLDSERVRVAELTGSFYDQQHLIDQLRTERTAIDRALRICAAAVVGRSPNLARLFEAGDQAAFVTEVVSELLEALGIVSRLAAENSAHTARVAELTESFQQHQRHIEWLETDLRTALERSQSQVRIEQSAREKAESAAQVLADRCATLRSTVGALARKLRSRARVTQNRKSRLQPDSVTIEQLTSETEALKQSLERLKQEKRLAELRFEGQRLRHAKERSAPQKS